MGNTGFLKIRRVKLSNKNKIEYLHSQLKKVKARKNALVEVLQDKKDELQDKEEELQSEKEKVNDIKKLIECPVCLDVPRRGPVYTCSNGHLVCQKCKRATCPTCRVPMGENKSLVAVKILEKILHDCKFVGCEEEDTLQDIEQHEKNCEYRLVACPNIGCDQIVPLSKLSNHLQIMPCSFNSSPLLLFGDSRGCRSYCAPINRNQLHWNVSTFLYEGISLALCVQKSGENWQFTVVMFECPKVCSRFKIEMEVYAADSIPETRLSAKVRCHPCSIDESVAEMKGRGLCVPHRFMERMIPKEDKFRFTVSFSFF